jgi:hypothetical protein
MHVHQKVCFSTENPKTFYSRSKLKQRILSRRECNNMLKFKRKKKSQPLTLPSDQSQVVNFHTINYFTTWDSQDVIWIITIPSSLGY